MCHMGHQVQVICRVKGNRGVLILSYQSKLPRKKSKTLDDTDPTQKVQGIAKKQNDVAMDTIVQGMSDTDEFHCILQV
jgi:hypothetical protein